MNELNSILEFERIACDDKEIDPNDDQVILSMRFRLFIASKILQLNALFPRTYPEEPALFDYGSLCNLD